MAEPAQTTATTPTTTEVTTSPATSSTATTTTAAQATPSTAVPLEKLMIDRSLNVLSSHKQLANRGLAILYRNLFGILYGSQFSASWENTILKEEMKSTKMMFQRTNVESLKRMKTFFESPKVRAKNGLSLALAIINPSSKTESFEHRLLLIWLGGPSNPRLFKIDGMKRDGIPGLTKEQTSWPAACTEVPEQGKQLWAALQVFITDKNPKVDWDKTKQEAFDVIISQPTNSIPFASKIELKGPQTFCCVTNDEDNLQVDLKNGLVERLKAIQAQLNMMQ